MARLKYPGSRKKSSPVKDDKHVLPSDTEEIKTQQSEDVPNENCKVITPQEYLQIFGDSDEVCFVN